MKLRKGDEVRIVRGKDKGKTGKIERVIGKIEVLIPNVNQYKRHLKKRSQRETSEIVTITKPLPFSNVCLICPKCKSEVKVGFKIEDKQKFRICKKCGKVL